MKTNRLTETIEGAILILKIVTLDAKILMLETVIDPIIHPKIRTETELHLKIQDLLPELEDPLQIAETKVLPEDPARVEDLIDDLQNEDQILEFQIIEWSDLKHGIRIEGHQKGDD